MKSYIMVWNGKFALSRKPITDLLDQWGPTWDWHSPMGGCIIFTSDLSASQLAKKFEDQIPVGGGKLFLIMECNSNRQGRLTARAWTILSNPLNPRGQ